MDEIPRMVAQSLYQELIETAQIEPELTGEGGLTQLIVFELDSYFLSDPDLAVHGRAARDGRDTPAYWRDHGRITGALMRKLAQMGGGNPNLYERTGIIHDVDYLKHPHDRGKTSAPHPVALVRALRERGVHPVICMAIMEHAPYSGLFLNPTSKLSAALSAAEDLATLAALKPPCPHLDRLSAKARELLDTLKPEVWIFRRERVRVETGIDQYINAPLELFLEGRGFPYAA